MKAELKSMNSIRLVGGGTAVGPVWRAAGSLLYVLSDEPLEALHPDERQHNGMVVIEA